MNNITVPVHYKEMKKVDVISIPVSIGPYAEYFDNIVALAKAGNGGYVCIANVHMLVEAYKNKSFAAIVRNANVVTPDGKPLTWALSMFCGIKQERVAGLDITLGLLSRASDENLGVYFYGGDENILNQATRYLSIHFPNLKVAGTYSPPYRTLTKEEEDDAIQHINNSGADLVFVVLGCPKQEKWMYSVQGRISAVSVGIGAALPVMVGIYKRAPRWMRESGFEWLFRLAQEPTRLFKRYAVTNSIFLYLFIKELIHSGAYKKVLPSFLYSGSSSLK